MDSDPFDLARFVEAQDPVFARAWSELSNGRKETHWMWFVFPQLGGLGRSDMAKRYGIRGMDEARAYIKHPILGERLRDCTRLLVEVSLVDDAVRLRLRRLLAVPRRAGEVLWERGRRGDGDVVAEGEVSGYSHRNELRKANRAARRRMGCKDRILLACPPRRVRRADV